LTNSFTSAESWLTLEKSVIVSTKPNSVKSRGGAVGIERVEDERQSHSDHEHVAHEVEAVVAPYVEPDQERRREHEVAVHVHEVGDVDQPALAELPALEPRLEEGVGRTLEVDDLAAVGESDRLLPVGDTAHGLVTDVGKDEEADLPQGIGVALGEEAPQIGNGAAHGTNCKGAVKRPAVRGITNT
jgi:hypothetical protein